MANIVINIDDAKLQKILDLFAQAHGYQDFIEEDPTRAPVPNSESKPDFLRRILIERIRRTVLEQEVLNASKAFREAQTDPGVS